MPEPSWDSYGESYGAATLSPDGLYRYRLRRAWGVDNWVNFIMLNPSTADADQDDPTIRRCIGFARRWGYDGLIVTNLYAYRATKPKVLRTVADPVGPDNDTHLLACSLDRPVVAAWGANADPARVAAVLELLPGDIYTLGLTKDGQPRHPLYVRADTDVTLYRPGVL